MKPQLLFLCGLLVTTFGLPGCAINTHYNEAYILSFVIITLIVASFIVLAVRSNLLRDTVNDYHAFPANTIRNPYSLSRVQLGVWTVVMSCSYIYLALCKGGCSINTINKSDLVLMGIGTGTAAVARLMDKREIENNLMRHQNSPSVNFLTDILSDDSGISIHRFQHVVWTVIAIIVYLYQVGSVATGCELPELSDTLLALTGISSTSYLMLKSKENDPAVPAVQNNEA